MTITYSRKLQIRLIWWRIWWSVCVLGFIDKSSAAIDAFIHPEYSNDLRNFAIALGLAIYSFLVFWKVPKKRKLILKDLRKDRRNLFAKAALLELRLAQRRKVQAKKNERAEVEEKIRVMKEELRSAE